MWKGKSNNAARPDGAHAVMASPVFKDGYGYAVGNQGDLRCFRAETRRAAVAELRGSNGPQGRLRNGVYRAASRTLSHVQ